MTDLSIYRNFGQIQEEVEVEEVTTLVDSLDLQYWTPITQERINACTSIIPYSEKGVDVNPSAEIGVQSIVHVPKETETIEVHEEPHGIIPIEYANRLRPFQVTGVLYAIEKKKTFIADEMGLGKTIEAIVAIESMQAYPMLVVCPASLKYNWYNELTKWIPNKEVYMFNGNSLLDIEMGLFPNVPIYIVNYEVLKNFHEIFEKYGFKAIIFDESHYLKTPSASRSVFSKSIAKDIPIVFCLTGTPVLNRPAELISQLKILGRIEDFGGEYTFERNYVQKDYRGNIINTKNLDHLNERMRELCYIRRNKKDVLKELPPKQKTRIELDIANRKEYDIAEKSLIYYLKTEAANFDTLDGLLDESKKRYMSNALTRIEVLKQLTAHGKVMEFIEWIEDFIDSGEKLVVFAHHRDIQKKIHDYFKGSARIFSEDNLEERQANIEKFQNDPECKLIVCSLQAGGVGITLTAASNVAFIELGWNPATHDQAEDRCHRIGQTDAVNSYYFVGRDTIEEDIWALIEQKRQIVDATLEGENPQAQMSILSELINRLRKKRR